MTDWKLILYFSQLLQYVEFKKERRLIGVGMKDLDSETKWLIPIDIICNDKSGRPGENIKAP